MCRSLVGKESRRDWGEGEAEMKISLGRDRHLGDSVFNEPSLMCQGEMPLVGG